MLLQRLTGAVEDYKDSTTTKVTCDDFDFDFKNANITGNVIINIPGVGEIFCGEAGTTSGGSTYTNKTSTYNAT